MTKHADEQLHPDKTTGDETTLASADERVASRGRRHLLGAAPLLAAAGLLWKPRASAAQQGHGASLILDVACLGDSNAANLGGAIDLANGDPRGVSFNVEGLVYPAGTIPPGPGFDPASAMATGHWMCRGWVLVKPDRPFPAAVVSQEFLLDLIRPDAPSPADTLSTSGVEPGYAPHHTVMSIVGGTGRYRHARGEVVVQSIGVNTTLLHGRGIPAPNFRFHFRF